MKKILVLSIAVVTFFGCGSTKKEQEVVNVYTKRHYQVDKDLFEKFEKELVSRNK